jgi:hypothetical protein
MRAAAKLSENDNRIGCPEIDKTHTFV